MQKIRLLAGLIAIVLTIVTILIVPYLFNAVMHWLHSLSAEQKQYFNYTQIGVGVVFAVVGFRVWCSRRGSKKS